MSKHQTSSSCPLLAVMSWPSCPLCSIQGDLSGQLVQGDPCWLSCQGYPVPDILSWMSSHDSPTTVVPSRLPCPSCPELAVMFWLSCPLFTVLAVISRLSFLVVQSRLSCRVSSSSCPALAPSSISLLPRCPVPAVLSWQSCRLSPVLTDLSRLTCQTDLSRLFSTSCPVTDVLPRLFWHGCPATVVPSRLSCPRGPVKSVLNCLSVFGPVLLSRMSWHGWYKIEVLIITERMNSSTRDLKEGVGSWLQ